MTLKQTLLLFIMSYFVSGCAHDLNLINMNKYFSAGLQAEAENNYAVARENYWRVWVNARDGGANDGKKSAILYNLARMDGYICNFSEAEAFLKQALEIELRVSGELSGNTSKRYFELARLYFDQEKYADSIPYYVKAIELSKTLRIEDQDPIVVADTLGDFSVAYLQSGNATKAKETKTLGNAIRERNPDKKALFVPVRYPKQCPK